MTKRLEKDVKGAIFKHANAMRYINYYLGGQNIPQINSFVLKIIIEQLLEYLEIKHGIKVKRK